ncbi:nucleoside permease [Bythopirellula polymerisocia]|uniref:Putative nucleoside transporter YegT n=1 Tax=Bythopirellula polymerisocia TaxID=2528003 RepID=A0A5C6CM75_9BACT|nr:nucleoside permease [Bythopirellula polymerisocia]TWU25680.1 putative nucleoside transporter YegT [Bythopirellula polymerisocia]
MTSVRTQLSIMMFLQFFIWGAWYVTVGNYMTAHGMFDQVSWAYTVGPIAAIISPVFLGMIADRFFATERVLAAMHLIGGLAMFAVPAAAEIGPGAMIALLMVHMLAYMPTLGLTNTLAFHNIEDQERDFPLIRVFGTIGWIAANWVVSKWLVGDEKAVQFYVTGIASIALAGFSLTLPHTPPPAAGKKVSIGEIFGVDALQLLKEWPFVVFIVGSFLICIPLAAYYAYAPVFASKVGFENVAFTMSFGQISEIVFMLSMPLFFRRLGVKWMLLVGMAAWVARYGLFAAADEDNIKWMVLLGILLHGICYDFFFVTGFIYTDKKCSKEIRGQAQGLLVLVTQGLGLGIGAQVVGRLVAKYTTAGDPPVTDWGSFWIAPAAMAGVVMLLFAFLFNDRAVESEVKGETETKP